MARLQRLMPMALLLRGVLLQVVAQAHPLLQVLRAWFLVKVPLQRSKQTVPLLLGVAIPAVRASQHRPGSRKLFQVYKLMQL